VTFFVLLPLHQLKTHDLLQHRFYRFENMRSHDDAYGAGGGGARVHSAGGLSTLHGSFTVRFAEND
jgi:hypothetical protein